MPTLWIIILFKRTESLSPKLWLWFRTDSMVQFFRCWKSKTFPYCDGAHNEHNKKTGDNVGPVVVQGNVEQVWLTWLRNGIITGEGEDLEEIWKRYGDGGQSSASRAIPDASSSSSSPSVSPKSFYRFPGSEFLYDRMHLLLPVTLLSAFLTCVLWRRMRSQQSRRWLYGWATITKIKSKNKKSKQNKLLAVPLKPIIGCLLDKTMKLLTSRGLDEKVYWFTIIFVFDELTTLTSCLFRIWIFEHYIQ